LNSNSQIEFKYIEWNLNSTKFNPIVIADQHAVVNMYSNEKNMKCKLVEEVLKFINEYGVKKKKKKTT